MGATEEWVASVRFNNGSLLDGNQFSDTTKLFAHQQTVWKRTIILRGAALGL